MEFTQSILHDRKKDVGPHEHQLMDMANMSCHYSECTICGELFGVGDHTFKDGKCTVCGHPEMINPFEDVKKDERINPFVDVKKDAWYHDEIVEAVKEGKFHVYPVSTIDEGIEILTGKDAGVIDENGNYPEDSINSLVSEKLKKYAQNVISSRKTNSSRQMRAR